MSGGIREETGVKMDIWNVALIGVALAMDACGMAISIGINCQVEFINKVKFALSFAFFQFLFAFGGAFLGRFINSNIVALPSLIGAIAILAVGIMMIREGMEDKAECILIKPGMALILGVSVSIDALVVGITALFSRGDYIFSDGLLIGGITLVLVTIAFILSRHLQKMTFIAKYSDYLGGIILILFALKMMFL